MEVHSMVEEFMVWANEVVAEKIYRSHPSCALLRHHPYPRAVDFEPLIQMAQAHGFEIDATSNKYATLLACRGGVIG